MKFDINDLPGKIAMHIQNDKELGEFIQVLRNSGRYWRSGDEYTDVIPLFWNETCCLGFNDGTYEDSAVYIERGYIVLEWSDFEG